MAVPEELTLAGALDEWELEGALEPTLVQALGLTGDPQPFLGRTGDLEPSLCLTKETEHSR